MLKKTFVVLASVLVAACSASGPKYAAMVPLKKGDAGVYVYRSNENFIAGAQRTEIAVDDKKLGSLSHDKYVFTKLQPGKHTVTMTYHQSAIGGQRISKSFEVKPGQVRYFDVSFIKTGSFVGVAKNEPRFFEIKQSDAVAQMRSLRLAV